jgi:hypothetical protein
MRSGRGITQLDKIVGIDQKTAYRQTTRIIRHQGRPEKATVKTGPLNVSLFWNTSFCREGIQGQKRADLVVIGW